MMLRGLEVEQVRRFGDPVRLSGLGPGLNLLAAPNEFGKSTLLAALRAVFMLQHGSKSEAVRSLQPYGQSASPRIAADFTIDGTEYRIEKRFVSRPAARLTEGGRVLEGEEAEAHLQRLIGLEPGKRGTEALGIMAALWVGQGQSLAQPELSDPARTTVRTCLEADLGAMTGGAEAERILARVRADLAILQDGRGNPKGRYRAAIEGEAEAADEIARLDARRRMLEDDLAAMAECRRRLAHEDNADRREKEHAVLAEARRLRDRLREYDALYRAACAAQAHAAARVEAAGQDIARRAAWQAELDGETARLTDLAEALDLAEARHAAAQAAHAARQQAVEATERARATARRALDRVEAHLALARLQRERLDEATRLDRLEQAEAEVARAGLRLAACTMDGARMSAIRQAERAVQAARAASRAQATVLNVTLEDGGEGRLVLDGRVLHSGPVDLTDSATLHIDGVGTIRIEPASGDRARLRAELAAAEDALRRMLDQAGCADPDAAETALAQRRQADLALNAARSVLAHLLPGTQDVAAALAEARRNVTALDERIARQAAALAQGPDTAGVEPDADVAAAHDRALRAMQAADARAADARQALFAPDETLRQAAADLARARAEAQSAREAAGRLARDMAAARAAEADEALSA
ncbi:ATP-binding protein, partial [Gluconacetobacter johannae]